MGGENKIKLSSYWKVTWSLGKLVVSRGINIAKAHIETKEVKPEWPSGLLKMILQV
jgi:hypothetical protein